MKNKAKKLYQGLKNLVVKLHQWSLSHPQYVRPLHTLWQAVVAYLVVTVPNIHTATDVKVVAGGAVAAGLSAAKSQVWPVIVSWATQQVEHTTQQ